MATSNLGIAAAVALSVCAQPKARLVKPSARVEMRRDWKSVQFEAEQTCTTRGEGSQRCRREKEH
jgi:hypothetical protein